MNEEGINQGIQTTSKVVGGLSFTTAATSSWWAMSVPWSDIGYHRVGGWWRFFYVRTSLLSVPENPRSAQSYKGLMKLDRMKPSE